MTRRTTSIAVPIAHLVGPGQMKVVNGYLAFKRHGESPLRLDPTALTDVYCYGDVSVSGSALELLFRHGVQTAWLSPAGHRCRGRLTRSDASTTMARVRQHRVFAHPVHQRDWAKVVVAGKIESMMTSARHYQRHGIPLGTLLTDLGDWKEKLQVATTVEQIRGYEGTASAAWFRYFAQCFIDPWKFPGRVRRPPTDPVNALLSLGYTMLLNRTNARAEASGLEVYLGGLHEYRAGRQSLSCDLIEPMRLGAVDRWVVSMCGQGQVAPREFVVEENGGFRLSSSAFARTIGLWETHWQESRQDAVLQSWIQQLFQFLKERDVPDVTTETSDHDL